MKPDKPSLDNCLDYYDAIIVGGGIVGAGIFRDLALHGVKALLIDKKDFASQTSNNSSKMLHGGIRYLENMDLKLIKEALHEKNLWLKLAPHLCYEASFYLPVYKNSIRPLWMINIGMWLYDALSGFKNTQHHIYNRHKTAEEFQGILTNGLYGSGVYYDAIVDDAKLTLENIYDALEEKNCHAVNHTAYLEHHELKNHSEVLIKDEITNKTKKIKAKFIIFAAGPFTDQLLQKVPNISWSDKLIPSKGSHIWVSKKTLPIKHPMLLTPDDGRVIFVIPQKNKILIGTTETEASSNYFDLKASEKEIQYLLENINYYFPDAKISDQDVISSFAGIRPLVMENNVTERSKTAREHKIFQPQKKTFVIVGGKLTTFRIMGQEITQQIVHHFKLPYFKGKTLAPLRQQSIVPPFSQYEITSEDIKKIIKQELVRTPEDLLYRRIGISNEKSWAYKMTFKEYLNITEGLFQ